MYVSNFNFEQVLDRFYRQDRYDFMLLFVSSFDCNDRNIIREILDNASRIDRITGDRICFFYFVKELLYDMNDQLGRWIKDINDHASLYGEGVNVTMDMADDICRHFHILRTYLPAFILITKYPGQAPQVLSIQEYQDFEDFLTPLNILHSYMEDICTLPHSYMEDICTFGGVNRLFRSSTDDRLRSGDSEELDFIKRRTIDRLNSSMNTSSGDSIIKYLSYSNGYLGAVSSIFELLRTRKERISSKLESIRQEILYRAYDVILSCKSQDYDDARELYDYLIDNGFKPFFAGVSIYELGIDQFTILIGEVMERCSKYILFSTNREYIQTPYVSAGWHVFINDMNTGRKPNAKLVNVLAPNIDPRDLPIWLRDKQCFTTENYKEGILQFLR